MNGGAESGNVDGWSGLRRMIVGVAGEPGLRGGAGRSGEYAFYWGGQGGSIRSDAFEVDTTKTYELTGWFKAEKSTKNVEQSDETEGAGLVSVIFGLVPENEALKQAIATGQLERNHKRGKWIGFIKKDVLPGEWVELKLLLPSAQWWPGVKKAQVLVSPKRMCGAKALWMDDLVLREAE